jgi:hypothetical protein
VDIAVTPPRDVSDAAAFVSVDSILAHVPGAESVDEASLAGGRGRLDRVRIRIEVVRPTRVDGGLRDIVERVARDGLGLFSIIDDDATPLLRIRSLRAASREERCGRDDLFPRVAERVNGVSALVGEPDVAAYLGGWG